MTSWLAELLAIFLADVCAGLLLLIAFEHRLEQRSENRRKKHRARELCAHMFAIGYEIKKWAEVGVGQAFDMALKYPAAYYGLDKFVLRLEDWNFENSDTLKKPAMDLYQKLTAWEQYRNHGNPTHINPETIRAKFRAILESSTSLAEESGKFKV